MWVYQEPEKDTTVNPPLIPALPEQLTEIPLEKNVQCDKTAFQTPEKGTARFTEPEQGRAGIGNTSRRKLSLPSRDCILLASAYLLGTGLSGVLLALCDTAEQETLEYYLHCWQGIFSASTPTEAVSLFGAELAVVMGAAFAFLLLGLSAVGPLPIFLFAMLYGTGSGLISAQLLTGLNGMRRVLFLLTASLPTALTAGALCLFGASALQVSSRIHAFSFGLGQGTGHTAGARLLLGQFALLTASLCPLCGAAAGLVCLTNRLLQNG